MTTFKLANTILTLFTLTIFLCACAITIQAQPNRTWVATSGLNTNPCSRTQPCRDFSFAITAVADGGEVVVLDSGGYGAVEITKSVQIIAPDGVHAAIAPASGIQVPGDPPGTDAAVLVNAPSATVVLRNLYVNKQGTTDHGIYTSAVGTLQIERCVTNGFNGTNDAGIYFNSTGRLMVRDTVSRNNYFGISVQAPPGETAYASIDGCRLEGNSDIGINAVNGSQVTVSNSVAANQRGIGAGFYVFATLGTTAQLNCESCVASNLDVGFFNDSGGGTVVMRVSRSVATNNNSGFFNQSGGTFRVLAGTNLVEGNTTDKTGTITAAGTDTNP